MKKQLLYSCLAVALGAGSGYALNAVAQQKPDVLVKQRQAAMTLISKYFGPLAGMAQGKIPYDNAVALRNADFLEALSKMPWDGFNASTKDEQSKALPAVFENAAKFREAADRFESEAAKLAAVSKSGDEAAIKQQIAVTAKTCGACHNDFRAK